MSHLFIELYDRSGEKFPCCTLNDCDVVNRRYFHDLHWRGVADRAARVVVKRGDEYHTGDHIRLLGEAKRSYTDTVAVDPVIAADVDLNEVIFDNHGFAGRTEAVLIVTNPNLNNGFRLRLSLYDQVGQKLPSLIFYDWEYPQGVGPTDLNLFHFANKAAFIRLEKGPDYQPGDRVILWEALKRDARIYALEPGDYDLTQLRLTESEAGRQHLVRESKNWADTVAGIELELQHQLLKH